ncbi:MAG: hypothetical protein RLZZ221_826, partial [Verrucomicrobiota bacterium]
MKGRARIAATVALAGMALSAVLLHSTREAEGPSAISDAVIPPALLAAPPETAPVAAQAILPRLPRFAAAAVAGDVAARTRELAEPGERTEAELLAIATERRGLLRELIPADPAAALACRLTYAQRRALPEAVAAQLETPVDAHGQLEVIAVCGPQTGGTERFVTTGVVRWRAFLAGARVQSVSQERMPVHGIAIDDIVAVAAEPYRLPDPGEVVANSAAGAVEEGIEVLVGEERRVFAAKEELDEWADRTRAAETQLPSPFKRRSVLFVRIDFSDAPGLIASDAEYLKSMGEVDRYYREMSADRVYFAGNTLPGALRSAKTRAYYNSSSATDSELMAEAIALAKSYDAANGGSGKYNPDLYDHVIVLFAKMSSYVSDVTPSGWAGQADLSGKRIWLNGYWDSQTIAHEIGHNLGLSHGHAWKPTASSPIGSGSHIEYGDVFDSMGSSAEKPLTNRHLSVPKKRALGFVTDANLISVQNSGEFRLFRHDGVVGSKAVGLKVAAGSAYDYWVEYRFAIPTDLSEYADAAASGVQLRWNSLPNFTKLGAKGTYLLDMTPGSAGDMKDSTLTLGNSFYDPSYKIRITPLRIGSSTEGDWIDVAVVLGDNPTNRSPVVQSAAAAETAFARVPVNLSAKASDADGNAVLYQWDLGDGKPVYSTDGTVQKLWATGGTYSATVRAFDIYGGESRQTFQIRVEDPAASWARATVPGLGTETLHAVCFGGGKFVAVGGFVACVSSDGKQWTKSSTGTSTMYAYAAAFGGSRYVAVGSSWSFSSQSYSTGIFYSSDGLAWSTASTVRSERLNSVTYGGGRFVAVGDSGIIWSSSDGQTWGVTQLISKKTLRGVAWSGTEFLAAGDSGTAIYSRDGANWFDASLSDSNTDASAVSWIKDTDATAVVSRDSGWYVISNWRYSDLSAGVSWSSASLGRWTGVARTYMPFEYYPSLAPFAAGSSLMTFPSTSATSAASLATSLDGVAWSSTTIGADGSGPLRGGIEGNGRIVVVGNRGQIYYSADGPPALARQPQTQTVNVGARASLSVTAYATGPFTYQWRKNGSAISGATADTLVFSSSAVSDSGDYSVAVTNSRGVVLSAVATLTVRPAVSAPVIVAAPASRVLTQGATSQLSVTASGTPAPTYQWFKDGSSIPGATGSTYSLTADGSASGGLFTVEVTNSAGKVTSSAASVRVIPTNRLANLSVRTALEGGQTLIVGAVVAEGTKGLLVRAAGPALNQFGLSGLPNPSMDLYTGGAQPAAS